MGYTHYWTQKRNFTVTEWQDICSDVRAILDYGQNLAGVPLANGMGDGGTSPELSDDSIAFNGLGDDSHETFSIGRKIRRPDYEGRTKGWDFCKTARKPYDPVVVACLCYLSTVTRREDPATHEPIIGTEAFSVSSDGDGSEWVEGLDMARKALPRYANVLDLPMAIMESDRWCAPWINLRGNKPAYEVYFCIDGRGYVLHRASRGWYCFESHLALAQFLERTKRVDTGKNHFVRWNDRIQGNYRIEPDIWNATGSFDKERHARLAKFQAATLSRLFPVELACAHQPPAYARPGEMPDNAGREFCYSVADLLKLCDA